MRKKYQKAGAVMPKELTSLSKSAVMPNKANTPKIEKTKASIPMPEKAPTKQAPKPRGKITPVRPAPRPSGPVRPAPRPARPTGGRKGVSASGPKINVVAEADSFPTTRTRSTAGPRPKATTAPSFGGAMAPNTARRPRPRPMRMRSRARRAEGGVVHYGSIFEMEKKSGN